FILNTKAFFVLQYFVWFFIVFKLLIIAKTVNKIMNTKLDFMDGENQMMVRQMAKDFAERNILPHVMEWDEAQHFPVDVFKEMGALGMMGVLVPEEFGGSGLGYHEYV